MFSASPNLLVQNASLPAKAFAVEAFAAAIPSGAARHELGPVRRVPPRTARVVGGAQAPLERAVQQARTLRELGNQVSDLLTFLFKL